MSTLNATAHKDIVWQSAKSQEKSYIYVGVMSVYPPTVHNIPKSSTAYKANERIHFPDKTFTISAFIQLVLLH